MAAPSRIEVTGDADVALARHAVRAACENCSDDVAFGAELVTSELVTNALLHGGGAATVAVAPLINGVRVEVSDRSRRPPLVTVDAPDAMTGRGVSLVRRLASRWGVEALPHGKTVWAEVTDGAGVGFQATASDLIEAWAAFDEEQVEPRLHVSLGEVPTPLLVAAKRHVDNLVREFALAAGGDRSGTTAPVPAPLAELIERVVDGFEDARMAIKRQATEAARAGRSHTAIELDLAPSAADAAEAYVNALDEIDSYSRANRLLTLETPPQHRVFRRWYIGEIVKQLRAVSTGVEPPPVVPFEDRLLAEVDEAEAARRSADRAARLYSVAVALASTTTAEEVAAAVLGDGAAALGATGGGVLLATDSDRLAVPGTVGYDEPVVEKLRQEKSDADLPAAHALRTGEAVWLETIEERNKRFPGLVGLEPDTIAMCAIPVATGGRIFGALRFSFSDRRLFDDDEQRFLIALAAEAGEALQRAELLELEREARERLEHERASLQKLAAVGEGMLRGGDLPTVIQLATDAATRVTGAEFGAFFYNADDDRGESYLLYALSGAPEEAFAGFPMPRNTSFFRPTFRGEGTIRIDDILADPRYGRNPPYHGLPDGHLPVRSYLAVPVTLPGGEVVGGLFLGHSQPGRFEETHERLVIGVAGQASAVIENVRFVEDRARVAATLQQSLLPAALPEIEGADVGAVYRAAAERVGGDFYDVFRLDEGRWGIAMGDVRGHGPQAAALTGMVRYTIRTAALLGRSPAQVCAVLNDAMASDDDPERFCSAIFAILEVSEAGGASVVYANAGHPPIAIVGGDGVELLPPTGGLVGIFPATEYAERRVDLRGDDVLVLYTDGVSEARQGAEEFGDSALVAVLAGLRSRPAQDVADALVSAATDFASAGCTDDTAVFSIVIR